MLWAFRKRLLSWFRSSLWIIPAISAVLAIVSAPLIRSVDRALGLQFLHFSSGGARALAGVIASAMLSFIVLFFSVLLLTVQIASSTLSPRVIARPFRSRTLKASLALFVFTLIYSMSVIARGTDDNVGQFATAVVIVLTVLSICVFLYVVEHVSKELRPVTVMAGVGSEGLRVIKAVYPEMVGEYAAHRDERLERLRTCSHVVWSKATAGVVQALDIRTLIKVAIRHDCVIEVVPQVGDFVSAGNPVFRVYGHSAAAASKALLQLIVLDRERTLEQDPAFAFRIIVDIASKALSAAINDPTTAVLALDQIHNLLREVGLRRLDTGFIRDTSGTLRLVYRTPDWEDFVGLAVTEIRQFGAQSTQVVRRLHAMLEDLIGLLPAHRAIVLDHELELLGSTIDQGFSVAEDRARATHSDSQGLGGHRQTA